MPLALLLAFVASLGVHGLALFGPDYELTGPSDPPPLLAELKPAPLPVPESKAATVKAAPTGSRMTPPHKARATRRATIAAADAPLSIPAPAPVANVPGPAEEEGSAAETSEASSAVSSALPAKGRIDYRVDSGDHGFQVGYSQHDWQVIDGVYRISAVTETSGLVGMLRPLRIDVESRGRTSKAGLVPERFVARQKGRDTGETADFDWQEMQLRMGERPPQTLHRGAQDILSFAYQLGLLANPSGVGRMSITTGKKYADFSIEVLGDEETTTPAGAFRCLHLRVPGAATTELWLAYDRALLPVKIRHVDRKGNTLVQVATAIEIGAKEPAP